MVDRTVSARGILLAIGIVATPFAVFARRSASLLLEQPGSAFFPETLAVCLILAEIVGLVRVVLLLRIKERHDMLLLL